MSRIRVMIIEDDFYSRYALYSLLSKDQRTTVIDEARDVEEAQWLLEENNGNKRVLPDVTLFDADLFGSGQDPVAAIRQLAEVSKERGYNYRIICCVMEPALPFIRAAVEVGVDAILKKEEVASGIADVVEKVQQGIFVYTRSVSQKAFGRIQGVQHAECYLVPERQPTPLNRKLRRMARLYCEDSLPAKEVAEILHLGESGVRRQVQQVYQILGARSRREARQKLQGME